MHIGQRLGGPQQDFIAMHAQGLIALIDQDLQVDPLNQLDDLIGLEPAAAKLQCAGNTLVRRKLGAQLQTIDETPTRFQPPDIAPMQLAQNRSAAIATDYIEKLGHAALGQKPGDAVGNLVTHEYANAGKMPGLPKE